MNKFNIPIFNINIHPLNLMDEFRENSIISPAKTMLNQYIYARMINDKYYGILFRK